MKLPEAAATAGTQPGALKRDLSRGFAMAVAVGGIIGLGIMRTPGEIAAVVSSPWLFIGLWLVGGLFVLLSIAVVAELVGMTHRSGGTYAMVRRAYGPFPGFAVGWIDWLSFVADMALKAVVTFEFFALLVPLDPAWQTPMAIAATSTFAVLQVRGIALGARIQQVAAVCMALVLIGFSLALFWAGPVSGDQPVTSPRTGLGAWSLVIASIVIAYDGWTWAAYFNGEVAGGGGAVARACVRGVVVIIGLYLSLMAALAFGVPLGSLAGSELALARALEIAISPSAASLVAAAAILILLASQNLLYMSAPRILYALASDGLAMRRAGVIHRGGNPLASVLICWASVVGLILIGGFEFLLYLCAFLYLSLYLILLAGVVILRRREPDRERPYRAWGHPWTTAICLIVWALVTAYQTAAQPETALYALGMVAVSWPAYRYLKRRQTKAQ
jgi:APA family basic amino acid/polyamine antiporter